MKCSKRMSKIMLWGMLPLLVLALASPAAAAPSWIQLTPTADPQYGSPPPRDLTSAVYNPATNRMIVFGGSWYTHADQQNDLWVLTNADGTGGPPVWIKLNPGGGPSPRVGHSAVFDQANNRMIVHGGQLGGGTLNDTWVLSNADGTGGDPPTWILLPTSGPAWRYHGAAYDAANNRMIIQGGDTSVNGTYTNDAWVLTNANGLGGTPMWAKLVLTPTVPLSDCSPAGYDPVSNTLISYLITVFSPTVENQVWLLKNANGLGGAPEWAQLTPSGVSPPTRNWATAVYDGGRNNLVIFGGGWFTLLNDAWRLENANGLGGTPQWIQLSPAGILPPPRYFHSAVYNPGTDRMIIYGGLDLNNQPLGDVWVLTEVMGQPPNSPPVAKAGPMQVVEVGTVATLDGSKSTDPEGSLLTYNWSFYLKPDGSTATLDNPTSKNPRFTPDQVGQYVLQLIVTDNQGLSSAPATVSVWGVPKVWNYTGSLNQARWGGRSCILQDGRVLVAGGWTAVIPDPKGGFPGYGETTLTCELYDPKTGAWTRTGDLAYEPSGSHKAVLLVDGRVFLCGGNGVDGYGLSKVQIFNPADKTWVSAAEMKERRTGHVAVLLQTGPNAGKVLVVGGQQWRDPGLPIPPDGKNIKRWFQLASAELYDPVDNTWTYTGSMNYARTGHLAGMLPDGRVLVTGGYGLLTTDPQWWISQALSATEIYDPATGAWSPGPTGSGLIPGRSGAAGMGNRLVALADGRLMVIGGSAPGVPMMNDVQIYDPQTGTWSQTGSLNQPRDRGSIGILPDGRVLVCGGWDGAIALNTAEIFNPVSGIWSFTGNLNQTRAFASGAMMADGRMLTAGGVDGTQVLDSAEVFGPPVINVAIDIKPGSFPNSINLGSRGVVPVAILSTPTFDARTVDPATVTLAGAHAKLKGKGTYMTSLQDVNGDGLPDLIVHVDTTALELHEGDTKAVLEGKTFDGRLIRGEDTVRIVP